MVPKGFIAETSENFFDGGIHFGFNISRTFQLKDNCWEPIRKFSFKSVMLGKSDYLQSSRNRSNMKRIDKKQVQIKRGESGEWMLTKRLAILYIGTK